MTHDPRLTTPDPRPLLLYDGECGFCAARVQFLLRHDRRRTLRFAPLGGVTARGVFATHPELAGIASLVWVERSGGEERVAVRSAAALSAAAYLGGLWRVALAAYIIPGPWRDWTYDLIARHRHRLGSSECLVPGPADAARFLP